MLSDITLGQYFPGKSPIHRMDSRVKIVLTFAFIFMLFCAKNLLGLAVGIVFCLVSFGISRISFKLMFKSLKPIIPFVIFSAFFNLFFNHEGKKLVDWKFITITDSGIINMIFLSARIILLVIGASLLTYTTSPIDLTDAIERLLSPLKKIKVPVHELAMMMTIALRFIPTLIEETQKIINAQKSRGADFESGSLVQKAKAIVPILVPLFVSSFNRAEELALAMECRCYNGGEGRTRLKTSKVGKVDVAGAIFTLLFFVAVIYLNQYNIGKLK